MTDFDSIIERLNSKLKGVGAEGSLAAVALSEEEKKFIESHQPQKILIVYGTLAPGQPNHSVIAHIRGHWQKGIIRGKLLKEGWGASMGYPAFDPVGGDEQEEIPAFILTSGELITNWTLLDEFEGSEYKRILAKYELEDGQSGVGYIYAINDDQR